ncbi:MAG TPA: glycoside hydrolase family 99-like domain-containing protein, partial [Spirochaetota bacterium]|nr:glycoside hydrolase family 99-like domain-containing protein [Spirochaetota bacterium]
KTISYWRKCCEDSGLNGLYVCAVDHFIDKTPEKYGVDAFVEFAPHGLHDKSMDCGDVIITNPSFRGSLRDMESVVLKSLLKKSPVYTYYRGVTPSWDNTARRQDSGVTFVNSSPALFEFWYHEIVKRIIKSGEKNKLVFVNAWNEWAEGCHLEPDKKYGTSFLKVIKRVNDFYNNDIIKKRYAEYSFLFNDNDMYRRLIIKALKMSNRIGFYQKVIETIKQKIRKNKIVYRIVFFVWAMIRKKKD